MVKALYGKWHLIWLRFILDFDWIVIAYLLYTSISLMWTWFGAIRMTGESTVISGDAKVDRDNILYSL